MLPHKPQLRPRAEQNRVFFFLDIEDSAIPQGDDARNWGDPMTPERRMRLAKRLRAHLARIARTRRLTLDDLRNVPEYPDVLDSPDFENDEDYANAVECDPDAALAAERAPYSFVDADGQANCIAIYPYGEANPYHLAAFVGVFYWANSGVNYSEIDQNYLRNYGVRLPDYLAYQIHPALRAAVRDDAEQWQEQRVYDLVYQGVDEATARAVVYSEQATLPL